MEQTGNKKTLNQDTVARTLSQKDNLNPHSPPQLLSFRQSPSPTRMRIPSLQQNQFPANTRSNPNLLTQPQPLSSSPFRALAMRLPQDIDLLLMQQRVQRQALLLQIGRLHEELYRANQQRGFEVRSTREQFQENTFLQLSQFRQNQQLQVEEFQQQIRKLKEQLSDKAEEAKRTQQLLERQKKSNQAEKIRANQEVRTLIEKKNAQIFELEQQGQNRLRQLEWERGNQIEELSYTRERQMTVLKKQIQQQKAELQQLRLGSEGVVQQRERQIQHLSEELRELESRSQQRLAKQVEKYDNVRTKFNSLINEINQNSSSARSELQALFESQYAHLMALIRAKDRQNQELRRQGDLIQRQKIREIEDLRKQNSFLQNKMGESAAETAKAEELLKVKLAALHETDLNQLKEVYELRLKHLSGNLYRIEQQNAKLREQIHLQAGEKYESRKKYETAISELNSRLMKLRMGMSNMENDFREKIENEKSLMLMTSRSFLKEAELKENNNKFLEEEVRKLRQLMDLQGRENQNSERVVEERIQLANQQLEQLSNRVVKIAQQKKEIQQQLSDLQREKDEEISRLRKELHNYQVPEDKVLPEIGIIQELREQLGQKRDEIAILKDKVQALESLIKAMQAETEQLQMQNNINSEEMKKEYHVVAQQHLKDFRNYYQQKLKRVEEEKGELKKIVSSQYEKITQLIKKYKETQQGLKEATKMMRKRTQLQQKVLNIGLDTNLVKNLAQLLPNHKQI